MSESIYLEEYDIEVKIIGKTNIAILKALKLLNRNRSWLAGEINMSRHTLNYKIKNNTVLADELFEIAKVLNIDLEKLKNKEMER